MAGPLVAILSGAGISTDSGIPDYRGPNAIARACEVIREPVGTALPRLLNRLRREFTEGSASS